MKSKVFKIFVATLILITLTSTNFLFLGVSLIGYATDNVATNHENVEFGVYLKENNDKIQNAKLSILGENSLYVYLQVKDKGVFRHAKVTFENPNFELIKDRIENKNIKSIEGNTIYFNEIIYGNEVEIELPIRFNKQENINLEYFQKETVANLEGEYQEDNTKKVEGKAQVDIGWEAETEVKMQQEIEKYIMQENKSVLLQQRVDIEVVDNILPVNEQTLKIDIPDLGEAPDIVAILNDGIKIKEEDYEYNEDNAQIIIHKKAQVDEQNNLTWGDGKDCYKIIYRYPNQAEDEERNIHLSSHLDISLYTQESINKEAVEDVTISKKGNIVTANQQITDSNYKGYLYSNTGEETIYQEKLDVEVSDIDSITGIDIMTKEDNFITEQNDSYPTNGSTYYKSLQVNKEDILRQLGEEGTLTVTTEAGEEIFVVDQDTAADEKGNIQIPIENLSTIKISMSQPQSQGNITIKAEKAIKSDTGYTKEQLKNVNKMESKIIVTADGSQEVNAYMNLLDTIPEAKLELNQTKFSTLEENKNIEIVATLKSNSNKHDLYKNPYIEIAFPSEFEKVDVQSIQKVYADEMQEKVSQWNPSQNKIEIQLEGEQKEYKNDVNQGIQIIINANVTVKKTTPTKNSVITLAYRNENRNQDIYQTNADITMNSKYGVLLYSVMNDYNEQKESIESTTQEVQVGRLDENGAQQNANINVNVINNYEQSINDVTIIGKIAHEGEDGQLSSTFTTSLLEQIQVNYPEANIYYSTEKLDVNSDQWKEQLEDITSAVMFKIVVPELKPSELLNLNYKVNIPENIESNEKCYEMIQLSYLYNEQKMEDYATFQLMTEEREENGIALMSLEEDIEGLELKVQSTTAGRELTDQEEVLSGSTVTHKITVTNNTERNLEGFTITGKQANSKGNKNVTFFNMKKSTVPDAMTQEPCDITNYVEDEDIAEAVYTKDVLEAGETICFEYEFTINNPTEEDETTIGTITLKANGYEQTKQIMENKIKQAELKLITQYGSNEEVEFTANGATFFKYHIENITQTPIKNISMIVPIPDGVEVFDMTFEEGKGAVEEQTQDAVTLKIDELGAQEEINVIFALNIDKIDKDTVDKTYAFSCYSQINENKYYSNIITKYAVNDVAEIEMVQESDVKEEQVAVGDEIQFTTTIKNLSIIDADLLIEDYLPEGLMVKEAYLEQDGNQVTKIESTTSDITEGEYISTNYLVNAKKEVKLVIDTIVGERLNDFVEFENYVTASGGNQYSKSNTITYEMKDPEIIDLDDQDDTETIATISGKAWIDTNQNGIQDEDTKIGNMTVILLDGKTGENITDASGETIETKTNEQGEYYFEDLTANSYMVAFEYDANKYSTTKYQVEEGDSTRNSDVISKKITLNQQEKTMAVTDVIELSDTDVENVDAGFYENKIFDLALQKTVKRVIVQNSKSTKVTEYNGATLAKVEIRAKELVNTNVIIEYNIQVTNEGDIAGQANEIVDYLPKDLKFNTEINKDWYLTADGSLHNTSLTNTILNPGESRSISLTVIKTMNENNAGSVINKAELQKASNNLNVADRDSTPGNNADHEDDIGNAEVIISIGTGGAVMAFGFILILLFTVSGFAIYYFKRKEEAK